MKEVTLKKKRSIVNLIEYCNIKQGTYLNESEYKGEKVQLNKPMRGDVKKYKVYVKNPKTGKVIKVNFGDKNMEIKRDNPERKKSFRARHKCDQKKDKTTAGYWSCKFWGNKSVSSLLESTTGDISPSKMIADLQKLTPLFAKAAQKVYDEWDQDEDGNDEMLGSGGICDVIAEEMCAIISTNTEYSCFDNYDESVCHTSVYVYHCYEEEMDEDQFENRAYLIHVDIPFYVYEKGGGYNWTKIPNVTFTPDVVHIYDMSGYAAEFLNLEACEPHEYL